MEQKRVFLAIVLSLVVLFVWQSFFGPTPEQMSKPGDTTTGTAATNTNATGAGTNTGATTGSGGIADTSPVPTPPKQELIKEEDVALGDADYKAVLTNKGGRLKSLHLLQPDQYTHRGDLIAPPPPEEEDAKPDLTYLSHLPFSIKLGQPATLPEDAMYKVISKKENEVVFRYKDPAGRFEIDKKFSRNSELPDSFLLDISLKNTHPSVSLTDNLSVVMYGQQPVGSGEWSLFNPLPDVSEAVCFVGDSVERAGGDDAKEKPSFTGAAPWGGVDSRYFTVSVISKDALFTACNLDLLGESTLRTELTTDSFNLAPGAVQTWNFSSYVGPKSVEQMAKFEVNMERSIDYGIFEFLCRPIRWFLVLFHDWTGNWGIAIIILTIFLRALMFPINQKSYKSMEGMRRIQEPMKELREKYENDPMKMQEEMMKLYRNEGVSPFGCLPQLLQIPVFFALYRTIYSSVELYHADFFGWYTDLSAPDPYFVLPVLVGAAMFGQQLLMPNTAPNPQMKYMMYAMPLIFSVFTFVLPSGLALYICVSVGLGIAQQYYIRKSLGKDKDDPKTAKA